jgi:hypothetical protein
MQNIIWFDLKNSTISVNLPFKNNVLVTSQTPLFQFFINFVYRLLEYSKVKCYQKLKVRKHIRTCLLKFQIHQIFESPENEPVKM